MKIIVVFIALLFAQPVHARTVEMQFDGVRTIGICSGPFDKETFVPITTVSIDGKCMRVGRVNVASKNYQKLIMILGNAKAGSFVYGRVRAKITELDAEPTYVDNDGGILSEEGQFHLSADEFAEVKRLLEKITVPNK